MSANATEGRKLESVEFGEYTLLSNEKLRRVLNFLEGTADSLWGENAKRSDEDSRLFALSQSMDKNTAILALYDRLGGGIKTKEGRKVALGTFYDFDERKPREHVKIGEEQFDDKLVLVRKQRKPKTEKDEDIKKRIAKLDSASKGKKVKDEDDE